jgi:hypothetical protein
MFDQLGGRRVIEPGKDASTADFMDVAEVAGAWFDATNTRPVRGRLFTTADQVSRPTVAVVDQELAFRMWGTSDAIGRALRIGADSDASIVTVIGVIPTRQEVSFRQPEGLIVIPGSGHYNPHTFFYVRSNVSSDGLTNAVRAAVTAVDRRVPILWVRTLEEAAATEVASLTAVASGLGALGFVALALAALGLFGVLAFIVAQRRYEIGVRVALGARRFDVAWLVAREALALAIGGALAGSLIAAALVIVLRGEIHGLQPLDPITLGTLAMIMVFVAFLASVVPARRAASVDPMRALRAE